MQNPPGSSTSAESPNLAFVLLLSCVAALGGFLFGYDSGCINGAVGALQKAFGASELGSGFNVASMLLGCAVGAFFAGQIADRFGRRIALFAAAVCFLISSWGSGAATSSEMFIVFRVIGGLAVGAASVIAPAYISEVAPSAYRGRLASLQQMAIVLGLFLAFLTNYLIAAAAGGASAEFWLGFEAWKWMFWAEIVPVVLFFIGLFLIPESPRYLVSVGKVAEAEVVLARVSGALAGKKTVAEIQQTLSTGRRARFRDLLDSSTNRIRPVVWAGLLIAALQQLVGINVVFYYGEVLWRAAGYSEANALIINVIGGVINVVSTLIAIGLVDRWGRKPLLMMGSIGMAVTLGALAVIFGTSAVGPTGDLELGGAMGIAALIAANLYIVAFGISWGPVMWVLLGEMFPNQIRGTALAVAGLSQWLTNFLVTVTFPLLLTGIGLGGAYALYAGFALISFFIVRAVVVETRGRSLEEM